MKFKCSISSCINTYSNKGENKFSFFKIPPGERGARWIELINQPELVKRSNARVCGAHFEDRYFRTSKRKHLKEDALPTLHFKTSPSIDEVNAINRELEVPGDPQDVKVTPINSTEIKVSWQPPIAKNRHKIIRGYHVHFQEIQEGRFLNKPTCFDVLGDSVFEINATGLQADKKYAVQVTTLTRQGDDSVNCPTPEGVPERPSLTVKIIKQEPTVDFKLEWTRPWQNDGELLGYVLRYGVKYEQLNEIYLEDTQTTYYQINEVERGVEYEFRVAGINYIGCGQEAVKYVSTPDGLPTGPPTNVTCSFQTSDILSFVWDSPEREHRNGQIIHYEYQFHKSDLSNVIMKNVIGKKVVFTNLEYNTSYVFRIRAYTSQGSGPYSDKINVETGDMGRAPLSVKAVATSESSVEVWWEPVIARDNVVDGYIVFYTTTEVDDLDEWQHKNVALAESVALDNLEKYAEYSIAVAARLNNERLGRLSQIVTVRIKPEYVPLDLRAHDVTAHSITLSWSPPIRLYPINYKISYDVVKEFVDSQQGIITHTEIIPKNEKILDYNVLSYVINDLSPFTTYNVKLSAIPQNGSYKPPSKITVTTQMAPSQPTVPPDLNEFVLTNEMQDILSQASEEYSDISHYYLIVEPEDPATVN